LQSQQVSQPQELQLDELLQDGAALQLVSHDGAALQLVSLDGAALQLLLLVSGEAAGAGAVVAGALGAAGADGCEAL
jgi:hypothetical protein